MKKINIHNYEAFLLDHMEGRLSTNDLATLKEFSLLHPELNIDLDQDALPYLNKETEKIDFNSDLLKRDEIEDEELISYLEGTLPIDKKVLFELKLEKDKTLQTKLHAYQKTKLIADANLLFEGKDVLYTMSDSTLLSDPVLNYFEEQLDADSKISFEKGLDKHSIFTAELALMAKTRLYPDTDIFYPNKEALKKEAVVIAFFSTHRLISMAAAILLIIGLIVLFTNLNQQKVDNINLFAIKNITPLEENAVKGATVEINKSEVVPLKTNASEDHSSVKNFAYSSKKEKHLLSDTIKNEKEIEKLIVENKKEKSSLPTEVKKDTTLLVIEKVNKEKQKIEPVYTKNVLLAYENDEEESIIVQEEKPGFWKKAARFANQANKLGMKAVNGEESKGDGFLLSINSLSIEKK